MEELKFRGPRLLEKFGPKSQQFLDWQNEFEFIVDFLEVTNDQKLQFLKYMIKPSVLTTIRNEIKPSKIAILSYEELISKLEERYAPSCGETAAEHRFSNRDQMVGETVPNYARALIKLLEQCSSNFNSSNQLMNRFVVGLQSSKARKLLLLEKQNLTFAEAVTIANEIEDQEIKDILNSLC